MIWIVHTFWLVNKCVFIALWNKKMGKQYELSNMNCFLQVLRIHTFRKKLFKVYICTSYLFLFVKTERNDFTKEIKHNYYPCLHRLVKTSARFGRILEQVRNERMDKSFWVSRCRAVEVSRSVGRGRPKKTSLGRSDKDGFERKKS